MTITYEYEGALYVNLTNKCNCNCEFCLRHGKAQGSIYTEDSLWLEREPTRQEALDSFLGRDVCSYREIVFCGYGEPTYRLDDILWLVDQLKERFGGKLYDNMQHRKKENHRQYTDARIFPHRKIAVLFQNIANGICNPAGKHRGNYQGEQRAYKLYQRTPNAPFKAHDNK